MNPFESFLIPLGVTPPDDCPYLDDRMASLEFYHPILPGGADFDSILARGFRRHGVLLYKPVCPGGCRECIPIRVPIKQFRPSKSQRRLLRRTADLYEIRESEPNATEEFLELFNKHARHVAEDSKTLPLDDYVEFLHQSAVENIQFEYRISGKLAGVGILDVGSRAASSIYFYWDPEFAEHSPGTFSALHEIDWCTRRGMEYYYLGYWVKDCRAMRYKERFRPFEVMDWATGAWGVGAER